MSSSPRMLAVSTAVVLLLAVSLISSLRSYYYLSFSINDNSIPNVLDMKKQNVAFCVLAKDEKDIYEWIDYHRQLGVSKFYVMDEYSDPPLSNLIKEFIDSGMSVVHVCCVCVYVRVNQGSTLFEPSYG